MWTFMSYFWCPLCRFHTWSHFPLFVQCLFWCHRFLSSQLCDSIWTSICFMNTLLAVSCEKFWLFLLSVSILFCLFTILNNIYASIYIVYNICWNSLFCFTDLLSDPRVRKEHLMEMLSWRCYMKIAFTDSYFWQSIAS